MKRYLLDTSIIIDFIRLNNKEQSLFYKLSEQKLFIAMITHTELFSGKSIWEMEKGKKILEEILNGLVILPITKEISEKAGKIKATTGISLVDSLIAATALLDQLDLVTLNRKDFERIPGIRLYTDYL